MSWSEAADVARAIVRELRPVCTELIVAGSLRRRKPSVGDIEVVCIARRSETTAGLFGDTVERVDLLDLRVQELLASGTLAPRLDVNGQRSLGQRSRRLLYKGTPLDLFSPADPQTFGAHLAIRTGPEPYSKRLVTPKSQFVKDQPGQRGWMPNDLQMTGGALRIRASGEVVPTPTEQRFFDAIGLAWVRPEDRGYPAGVLL